MIRQILKQFKIKAIVKSPTEHKFFNKEFIYLVFNIIYKILFFQKY